MGNTYEFINLIANRVSNIQCLFPTVGQCTTSPSVSAMIGRSHFGTAPFTLPLVSDCLYVLFDCLYGVRAVFSVSSSWNPSWHYILFYCWNIYLRKKLCQRSITFQIVREETRCRYHMGYSPIISKGSFICTIPIDRIVVCIPVVEHWLEQEIAQLVHQ